MIVIIAFYSEEGTCVIHVISPKVKISCFFITTKNIFLTNLKKPEKSEEVNYIHIKKEIKEARICILPILLLFLCLNRMSCECVYKKGLRFPKR